MNAPDERDIQRASVGRAAGAALTVVDAELDRREEAVSAQVFRILNDPNGILDPQKAVQAWIEIYEIRKLRQSLTKRERIGAAAADRVKPAMTPQN